MRVAQPRLEDYARRLAAQADAASSSQRPLVAVSGGPDSVALLVMMAAMRPGRFAAATFDHQLRPAAAQEAAAIADLCAERGVTHAILRPDRAIDGEDPAGWAPGTVVGTIGGSTNYVTLPHATRPSLQARARTARYDALVAHGRATGCDVLLTAHHLNDQAETFLMRASRGSGVDGLAGVRRVGAWDGFPVHRPLLDWERRTLAEVLRTGRATAIDDPSNADPAYDRTRIRALLADAPDLKPQGLARSAAALADASEALGWVAEIAARQRIEIDGETLLISAVGLPREVQRRVLVLALERMGERPPRGPALDGTLRGLAEGARTSLGGLLLEGRTDGRWALSPAPPRTRR